MRFVYKQPNKIYKLSNFLTTSDVEIKDISKAWFAISLAFGIVLGGLTIKFFTTFIIAAIAVGLGFLLHELSHKYFAQRYGFKAEFRSFDEMLFLAVIMSFFGFVIAAPGAVMILSKVIDKKKNGIISIAGPLMNLILAGIFFLTAVIITGGFSSANSMLNTQMSELLDLPLFYSIIAIGFIINSWLALFNLIPFWLLDGAKVFKWNKIIWGLAFLLSFYLVFLF